MTLVLSSELSQLQQKFISLALNISQKSPLKENCKRVGAIIVGNGTVLATGFNQYRNTYITPNGCKTNTPSLHAEVHAVLNYYKNFSKCSQIKVAQENEWTDNVCY